MNAFEKAVGEVLAVEGGFVNHPLDKGGPTNFGITKGVLENYRGRPVSVNDVQNMPIDEAKAIYKKNYWDPLRLDEVVHSTLAEMLFDQAVNRGISAAAKNIQTVVGAAADGKIGPATLAAINKADGRELCIKFFKHSQLSYIRIVKSNPTQLVFLEGWINRTHKLLNKFL